MKAAASPAMKYSRASSLVGLGQALHERFVGELGAGVGDQAGEPFGAGVAVAQGGHEVGVQLPLAAVAEGDGVDAFRGELLGGFLDLSPGGGEGVVALLGPHGLVVDHDGAGAAGQHGQAVDLAVGGGEGGEVGGVVIRIVGGSLDDVGHVHHEALIGPGDGVHALQQEDVGQVVRRGQGGDLGLVLGVGQHVLGQVDVGMGLFPGRDGGAEAVGAAVALGLFGGGEVHEHQITLVLELSGRHGSGSEGHGAHGEHRQNENQTDYLLHDGNLLQNYGNYLPFHPTIIFHYWIVTILYTVCVEMSIHRFR